MSIKCWISSVPVLLSLTVLGCDTGEEAPEVEAMQEAVTAEPSAWEAELAPINDELAQGLPAGQAQLMTVGDSLVIEVNVAGVPPDMMHLQHFHGFEDGASAECPGPEADANGDGVIDVTETADAAGTTMVPFHDDPASMEIEAETYPQADAEGTYRYRQAVDLESLRTAFQERFGTRELDLADRVVFVHGIPADAGLPESAASVLGVPAHVTVPILCGALEPMG